MPDRDTIIAELEKPFPPAAIQQRQGGGGKMLDYVSVDTVIRRLNHATQNNWSFTMTRQETIPWGQTQCLIVYAELEIPGLGVRAGTGVQLLNVNSGEDVIKGAAGDALKKCATLFGVAIDLYGIDRETGEVPQYRSERTESPRTSVNPSQVSSAINAITDKQRGKLFGEAKTKGISETDLHQYIYETYEAQSVNDLSKQQASEVIDLIMAGHPLIERVPVADAEEWELSDYERELSADVEALEVAGPETLKSVWVQVATRWKEDPEGLAELTRTKDARKRALALTAMSPE